eukprot:scaffold14.g1303.t1
MAAMQSTFGSKAFLGVRAFAARPARAAARRSSLVVRAKIENDQVASAYANALVEVAQKTSSLEAVHSDVDALAQLLKDNEAVKDILTNPIIAEQKKKDLVQRIASEAGFSQYTTNFLKLLLDQNRMDVRAGARRGRGAVLGARWAIEEITESFESSYCQLTDTQVAVLRSAVKLEQEQQFLIAKKLQELTGSKNIKLKPVVDPALVAGFVVEYGSTQIDLSVKGQLDKISGELLATAEAL